jgi:tRNA-dihydrouridine synthase B
MAGSALMQHEQLVGDILDAVVGAVPNTPVTLKFRTGWNIANKNAPNIARIAENAGIRAVAIHGRTRCQQYTGEAEYDTIAYVKTLVKIPVIANGDITTPEKAKHVLDVTGADGVMIGRAAQGRPWLFREIEHYLKTGEKMAPAPVSEIHAILLAHLEDLYDFYGLDTGVKVARKHISWYTKGLVGSAAFRKMMNTLPTVEAQREAVDQFFQQYAAEHDHLQYEENKTLEEALAA